MFTAEQFRTKVAEGAESIKNSDIPSEIRKFERSMESFDLLAKNEEWLADAFGKMIRSQDVVSDRETTGKRLDRGCRRDRGAHSAVPRGGCYHAVECDSNEAATRAFRYPGLPGRRTTNGHAKRPDCPLLA